MLDVHPPHHPTHSWRDFFIHIATIVIGLVIAVGLEQAVEAIHHHHQVAQVREALLQERQQNHKNFMANTAEFRETAAFLQNDLLVLKYLRQHPGTPEEKLPGVLDYTIRYEPMLSAEWKTAQQTGVTELMPRTEVTDNDHIYELCSLINSDAFVIFHNVNLAKQYRSIDPDLSHLTPSQIDAQIKLTQDSLTSVYEWGVILESLGEDFPDFTSQPTRDELHAITELSRSPQDTERILPAKRLTDARTKAFTDARGAAAKAAEEK